MTLESGGRPGRLSRRADLHVHTSASDGELSPEAVVDVAAAIGLGAVAITDHDTVSGVEPAMARSRERGDGAPLVVPGIEINTDYGQKEIHVLGYFVRWDDPVFAATLQRLREGRVERVRAMLAKLAGLGVRLEAGRVMALAKDGSVKDGSAKDGSVGRPHVARAMVEAGIVKTVREAFERYLSRGRPAYVERMRFTPAEAVVAIRKAGGVAVLAHPGEDAAPSLIDDLVAAGLGGIEVFHPEHDRRHEEIYRALAEEKGLVATGGSDSHGVGRTYGADIGEYTVGLEVVAKLREEAVRRSAI